MRRSIVTHDFKMLHTILAAVIYGTAPSTAMSTSHTLRKNFDSSGAPVCSVDPPSHILPMSSGSTPCSSSCSTSSVCLYCQYKADKDQCELYNDLPQNSTTIDQCIGFTLLISEFITICTYTTPLCALSSPRFTVNLKPFLFSNHSLLSPFAPTVVSSLAAHFFISLSL